MGIFEIIFIGLGLSMDACAISICKGLSARTYHFRYSFLCGLYFGLFQSFMPLLGYILGMQFKDKIQHIDHYIILILLSYIGINMIKEAYEDHQINNNYSPMTMIPLSIASSIDALAIGITFSLCKLNIIYTIIIIGLITFIFSFIGVIIGTLFSVKYKEKAELCGGIILILIGLKIFIEHIKKL